jgi:hypothetical protein
LAVRVEAGAVVDEFDLPGIGQVVARHTRMKTPEGVTWACMFTVVASGNADLAVVHRLSAPSLAEGRRSVRNAVEFLAGRVADNTVVQRPPRRRSTDTFATDGRRVGARPGINASTRDVRSLDHHHDVPGFGPHAPEPALATSPARPVGPAPSGPAPRTPTFQLPPE